MTEFRDALSIVIGCATEGCENLRFPFRPTTEVLSENIDILGLSIRANHCLMRNDLTTISKVVDIFSKIKTLRNCGAKTANEIREAVCDYLYSQMSNVDRKQFWREFIALNEIKGLTAV